MKKASENISHIQSIVEKAVKEDDRKRKKGIIPRLSTDVFRSSDSDNLLLEEIGNIIDRFDTVNEPNQTEAESVKLEPTECNNMNTVNMANDGMFCFHIELYSSDLKMYP